MIVTEKNYDDCSEVQGAKQRTVFFRSPTGVGGKGARVYRVRYHGNALAADFGPQDGVFFARVRHANPVVAIGQRQLQ
jgi:hypothetical protein